MSKVEGKPLLKLNKDEKAKAWDSILGVMEKMHKRRVTHNDLHAANLLYDVKNNKVNVVDFGKAKFGFQAVVDELEVLYYKTKDDFYNATGPKMMQFASRYEKMQQNKYFEREPKGSIEREKLMGKWVGEVYGGS